jgi:hypothetical protein
MNKDKNELEDLDPASEAIANYKDPEAPVAGASNARELHDRVVDVRDESS